MNIRTIRRLSRELGMPESFTENVKYSWFKIPPEIKVDNKYIKKDLIAFFEGKYNVSYDRWVMGMKESFLLRVQVEKGLLNQIKETEIHSFNVLGRRLRSAMNYCGFYIKAFETDNDLRERFLSIISQGDEIEG